MEYTPISPFKRPISRAHLRLVEGPATPPALSPPVNKWALLRDLATAQAAFGVTDRDLTVLQGLLSFFPGDDLGGDGAMVVFPSNRALCERLNGMACSTMRRHLARLVEAGLLIRRDSPNGKRYSRKDGADRVSFGLDLSALHRRAAEIASAADTAREAGVRLRRLREAISLMRRDLAALALFGEEAHPGSGLWDEMRDTAALAARALRRKLTVAELLALRSDLGALLGRARERIDGAGTEEMIISDARNERHHQNSETEPVESESAMNSGADSGAQDDPGTAPDHRPEPGAVPNIPLSLVTASCPSIATFHPGPIRHWHQLFAAASALRPAMGISLSAWDEAQRCMGSAQAAIVLVAMLERFAEIRSPGGYLRALSAKALAGRFSCGPMVMALTGRRKAA
ncbi:MAG: replication initiation protein [Rubellimicrobium sp.]|nr:replication initiation protein [Rubellimicrobium sp.]